MPESKIKDTALKIIFKRESFIFFEKKYIYYSVGTTQIERKFEIYAEQSYVPVLSRQSQFAPVVSADNPVPCSSLLLKCPRSCMVTLVLRDILGINLGKSHTLFLTYNVLVFIKGASYLQNKENRKKKQIAFSYETR